MLLVSRATTNGNDAKVLADLALLCHRRVENFGQVILGQEGGKFGDGSATTRRRLTLLRLNLRFRRLLRDDALLALCALVGLLVGLLAFLLFLLRQLSRRRVQEVGMRRVRLEVLLEVLVQVLVHGAVVPCPVRLVLGLVGAPLDRALVRRGLRGEVGEELLLEVLRHVLHLQHCAILAVESLAANFAYFWR